MRFNKSEMVTLALQPSNNFDKEGVLIIWEKQEGFFKRTEIPTIIAQSARNRTTISMHKRTHLSSTINATLAEYERSKEYRKDGNRKVFKNYPVMLARIKRRCVKSSALPIFDMKVCGTLLLDLFFLQASLERWCRLRGNLLFYMKTKDQFSEPVGVIVLLHCTIRVDHSTLDGSYGFFLVFDGGVTQHFATYTEHERDLWLEAIQVNNYSHVHSTLSSLKEQLHSKPDHNSDLDIQMWRIRKGHHSLDVVELPLCEISLSCDNLLCDGHGKPPRSVLVVHIYIPKEDVWLKYANTETIEKSSNPSFLKTVCFWPSDGLSDETCIRITSYDVREKFSGLSTPLGSAKFYLSTLLECQQSRFRVQLLSSSNTVVGFLTLTIWRHERETSLNTSTKSTPCRVLHQNTPSDVPCHRRTQSLPSRFNVKQKIPNQGHLQYLFANALLTSYRFHSGLGGDISVYEIMAESRLCFKIPQQLLEIWMNEEKELLQEVAGMGELVEPWNSRQLEVLDRHLQLLHMYSQAKENLRSFKCSFFKASSRKEDRSLEFAPVNLHLQRMWVQNDTLKKSGFYDTVTMGACTKHSQRKNGGLIKLIQQLKESPASCAAGQMRSNKITLVHDAIQAIKLLRREIVEGMKTIMKLAKKKQSFGMLPICEEMVSKTRILLSLWDAGIVEEALNFIEENKVNKLRKDEPAGLMEISPLKKIAQQISLNRNHAQFDELMTPTEGPSQSNVWHLLPHTELNGYNLNSPECTDNVQFPVMPSEMKSLEKKEISNLSPTESLAAMDYQQNSEANNKLFLDTHAMCTSPSANYYKPTEEPEPWDLTQLNIEASVMCLVSKVKFLCGRCGSPSVRIRSHKSISRSQHSFNRDIRKSQISASTTETDNTQIAHKSNHDKINKPNEKGRNKFTEGLDFDSMNDWTTELKPSMQKLRQAMDGLLKTARLTHSVFRIQEDRRIAQSSCNIRYRRHVCFSQALTALISGLMAKLWCQKLDPLFLHTLTTVGPLAEFEGLLSYYGDEIDMWGDMVVAIEDLSTVNFTLVATKSKNNDIQPQVIGSKSTLGILLPVPEAAFSILSLSRTSSFTVTPVFFNIGINETATLAESLGVVQPQEQSNIDNFDKLNEYYHRLKKLNTSNINDNSLKTTLHNTQQSTSLAQLLDKLKTAVHTKKHKNVDVLLLASQICRKVKGLRFTSCKSAKDRTGMAVTLEQVNILHSEYDLAEHEFQRALDCMRSEGVRRENTSKNIGVRKYAFNSIQALTFPKLYRPPSGTYGALQS